MRWLLLFSLFTFPLFFGSCASGYKSINPTELSYPKRPDTDGVNFSYSAGVIAQAGNKKYYKKERSKDIQVIAVKLTNNTDKDLIFSQDILLESNGLTITPLTTKQTYSNLKQVPAGYLLYLLLTPIKLTTYNENTGAQSDPMSVGYILGPGLSLINMAVAQSANVNFKNELETYDLNNKVIGAGETVYGLIGVANRTQGTYTVKVLE